MATDWGEATQLGGMPYAGVRPGDTVTFFGRRLNAVVMPDGELRWSMENISQPVDTWDGYDMVPPAGVSVAGGTRAPIEPLPPVYVGDDPAAVTDDPTVVTMTAAPAGELAVAGISGGMLMLGLLVALLAFGSKGR